MDTASETNLTMTPAAIEHVRRELNKRGAGIGIRVSVKETGCSGLSYVVDMIDDTHDNDHVYQVTKDVALAVSPEVFEVLKGSQLDYVKKGLNQEFEFKNPNATSVCGCGESFKVG